MLNRCRNTRPRTPQRPCVRQLPLPQQLASETPQRHCADAAAATAGIRDAATSRPTRIAAAATFSTKDAATSNPCTDRNCHLVHCPRFTTMFTTNMASRLVSLEGRRNVKNRAEGQHKKSRLVHRPQRSRSSEPKVGRNNLRARPGPSKMHLLWNRAGLQHCGNLRSRTGPSKMHLLWNRAGLPHRGNLKSRTGLYSKHHLWNRAEELLHTVTVVPPRLLCADMKREKTLSVAHNWNDHHAVEA